MTDEPKRKYGRWVKPFVWFAVGVTVYGAVVGAAAWTAGDFSPPPFAGNWNLIPFARLTTYSSGYAPMWLRLAAIGTAATGVTVNVVLLGTVDFERRFDHFSTVLDALISTCLFVALVGMEWHERRQRR